MKKLPLAAVGGISVICLFNATALFAEETDTLDDIVVTADRKARTVDETLAPVTIITRQDIERYQASDMADVLRRVPGINIRNSGGTGQITSLSLRGTNSTHILVLIDGVKVGSATAGLTSFEHLPLGQVERIEIVRGPRSSLYGSEAIGGVIQIFTRNGGKGFQPEINLGAGSHNQKKADINLAGGDQTTWYNLNLGREETDGINACSNTSICFAAPTETDPDGYQRTAASLRFGHRFASKTAVEIAALQAKGNVEYDGSFQDQSDFLQQANSLRLQQQLGDRALLTARLGQSKDNLDSFKGGVASSNFNTRRDTASVQADIQTSPDSNLTLGADKQTDKISSDTAYTQTSRQNTGIFANYQHSLGATAIEVSLRQDDNGQFGKHTSGGLAVGHELPNNMRVKASYGKAFRAPSFNELYYPFGGGNPDLKPESSQHQEIGLQGKYSAGTWEVNVFDNQINDMISGWPALNTDKASIQGVEAIATSRVANWDVSTNLTLQDAQDSTTGKQLRYRPAQILNMDADRKFGKLGVGASIHAESTRYDDAANATKLPGYGTLDLRASYKPAKDWTIGAKLGNVLDKQYETNLGYRQDGVNGLVTVTYAPQ